MYCRAIFICKNFQTCVAPDYILCEKTVKDEFVSEAVKQIKIQYGENPLENRDYGKIINKKHT